MTKNQLFRTRYRQFCLQMAAKMMVKVRVIEDKRKKNPWYVLVEQNDKNGERTRNYISVQGNRSDALKKAKSIKSEMSRKKSDCLVSRTIANQLEECSHLLRNYENVTIVDAVKHYVEMTPVVSKDPSIFSLVSKYIEHQESLGAHPNTVKWMKNQTNTLRKTLNGLKRSEATGRKIIELFNATSDAPVTKHNKVKIVRLALDSPLHDQFQTHGLITKKDIKLLPVKRKIGSQTVLTPDQAEGILQRTTIPDIFMFLIYTGMRMETLKLLKWEDVDRKHKAIKIDASINKKNRTQFLQNIPGNFWEWVELVGKPEGKVFTIGNKQFYRKKNSLLDAVKAERSSNIFRRSFATHALHVVGLNKTLLIMTHKGSPSTFWNNYYNPILQSDSEGYFEINPLQEVQD